MVDLKTMSGKHELINRPISPATDVEKRRDSGKMVKIGELAVGFNVTYKYR